MTFKKLLGTSIIAATMAVSSLSQAAPAEYEIDMSHTNVLFNVNHLGLSNMLGRFDELKGSLVFDKENIENSKVEITIATASVNTFHAKRDEHLSSPDFFNAAEFPEMTFSSTAITRTGDNTATLTGDLTLMGVTKPVNLDLTINKVGEHPFNKKQVAGFTASGTIKRSDYGMKYGAPMIGDDIALRLELEAGLK
ncbi:YceI family protein [uncultured Amphritea sp.]|uniref:YceI family protein n=1 Tax=uncultured Amphritea sp. TaxID=981605 RepID=UPI0025F4B85A|nr:YceI family protein [uncultured Amphritea sp.]